MTDDSPEPDAAAILSRAAEIANGARLKFNEHRLRAALTLWLRFCKTRISPFGDPARHRDLLNELRAHLQAFPMDNAKFSGSNIAAASESYVFRNPAPVVVSNPSSPAPEHDGGAANAAAIKPQPVQGSRIAARGCWTVRRKEIERPGMPDEMVEAIGIYNDETAEFKLYECVGQVLDEFVEDNPEQSAEELEEIYWSEAESWAHAHNTQRS